MDFIASEPCMEHARMRTAARAKRGEAKTETVKKEAAEKNDAHALPH